MNTSVGIRLSAILLMWLISFQVGARQSSVENLVFVGRLIAIRELPSPCEGKEACLFLDALYEAHYEIEEVIVGEYEERHIAFRIADHYGFPLAARADRALLFVGKFDNGLWLRKYQGFPLLRVTDGGWGYCTRGFERIKGRPAPPTPRRLNFADALQPRDGEGTTFDLDFRLYMEGYRLRDGRISCKKGLRLPQLYEAVRLGWGAQRNVALPAWPAESE